ncbi:GNAT family N-acetyltransferase [Bacillus sp. ISL-39]|uniref:GNAT family N-acetyltransferase n=1 Tax=Bacillus sp. ISL-39 TaxID=2819124 RepID=UPI001BE6CBAB|nr:GNAT family N-acetyltransferase [Bacillus sp. ISL-39]MBT2639690.1 peptidoglycan bridge formation glycyltransferase FemA/FemB family protein [Bacillus sp. ISL-39]
MLTIRYMRKFLRFTETYSSNKLLDLANSDIQIDSWLLVPKNTFTGLPYKNGPFQIHKAFKTLVIDLQKSENDIFQEFQKSTRYKINRADREGVSFRILRKPNDREIQEFIEFFDEFARAKKIRPCIPAKIKQLRNNNAFVITKAMLGDRTLACHGYIFDRQRTNMLYSASLRAGRDSSETNLIGRANRFLHWNSILSFKELGCNWYDFCGLSQNPNDIEGQGINKFKKGFGGFEAYELKRYSGQSLKGKLAIVLFHIKWRNTPEYLTNIKEIKPDSTQSHLKCKAD